MKRVIPTLPLLLLSTLALLGCGGASSEPPTIEKGEELRLSQVAECLRNYQLAKGTAPRSIKDLRAFPGDSGGTDLVVSGEIIVQWGATLPDTKEEPGGSPGEDVLAYGKDVPTQGGPVLLLNRTVRRMSADEFKSAPLAKPAP